MPGDANQAVLTAGCKVNLSLRITGRREDGYHTLESIFWPLASPADVLRISREPGSGLRFSCNDASLEGAGNIVVKAYHAFARETGFTPGLLVHLEKNIPHGAGLGGGSSDAAALLLHLNGVARDEGKVFLSLEQLTLLGAGLGADVPFFFRNAPSRVTGIGEILEPLSPDIRDGLTGLHLVLVCPRVQVATAWAFGAWDEKHPGDRLTNGGEKDSSPLVRGVWIRNDFCSVVFKRYPVLEETLARLEAFGADAACMSGTGASLFGLFSSPANAENALRSFQDANERVFHHIL